MSDGVSGETALTFLGGGRCRDPRVWEQTLMDSQCTVEQWAVVLRGKS